MNLDAARPGQRNAYDVGYKRFSNGESYTSIVLPTRYGKTDVARLLAVQCWKDKIAGPTVFLSVNNYLKQQAANKTKFAECLARYSIFDSPMITTLDGLRMDFTRNGEVWVSSTVQLVHENADIFVEWVRSSIARNGMPPIFWLDECHMTSQANEWGKSLSKLADVGALIGLLTATPYRSDGMTIPGFDYEELSREPVSFSTVGKASRPDYVRIDEKSGVKVTRVLIPSYGYSFRDAWNEMPSPICKMDRVTFDADLSKVKDEDFAGKKKFSELNWSDARRILGKIIRDSSVIRPGCDLGLQHLREHRRMRPGSGMHIFCGNDIESVRETNKHARQIERILKSIDPSLRVVIATSADGKEAATKIEAYIAGKYDVLITKQMAGAGLDAERTQVILDLSSVRTPNAFTQRIMRAATPYHGSYVATYITIDDIMSRELFKALVADEGGSATVSEVETIRSREEPRKDHPDIQFTVDGTYVSDFEDTDFNWADRDLYPLVREQKELFPELSGLLTDADIAVRILDAQKQAFRNAPVDIIDTSDHIQDLRDDINKLADEITNEYIDRLGGYHKNKSRYGDLRGQIFGSVYRDCNIPNGWALGDISDLELLRKIKCIFEEQHLIVVNGGGDVL